MAAGTFALGLGTGLIAVPAARAAGTVATNSTAALLTALRGGGLVQATFSETLTLELPVVIAEDTVLQGAGSGGRTVVFSGGSARRLFQVLPGVRFELQNCTLRDGRAPGGGAIMNEGVLIASNVVFSASKALGAVGEIGADGETIFGFGKDGEDGTAGADAAGGAVFNAGEATFLDCTFSANAAEAGDGGKGGAGGAGSIHNGSGGDGGNGGSAFGGAIANTGTLTVERSLFTANSAGGGDAGAGGAVGTTTGGTGAGNGGAGGWGVGGAIYSAGWLGVGYSTFATNLASGGNSTAAGSPNLNAGEDGHTGGPALGGAIASWSTGYLVNSTLYTNLLVGGAGGNGGAGTFTTGDGGNGGDALGAAIQARGVFAVTNATLYWNVSTNGAGGAPGRSGLGESGAPGSNRGTALAADPKRTTSVKVVNSILATTTADTTYGPVVDAGANLFSDRGTGQAGKGSIFSADPGLGSYGVWTSGTPGFLPLSGSPAIDAADRTAAPALDQRRVNRPIGVGPDIGALESALTSYLVAGQVLEGEKGLNGIQVNIGDLVQVTDGEGRFQFGPLPAGFYTVALPDSGVGFSPRLVQLSLAADVTDLVFRAIPLSLAVQRDAVTGVNRLNAVGRPGREFRLEGSRGLESWETLVIGYSDAQGRVVFEHAPGEAPWWFYRLTAF